MILIKTGVMMMEQMKVKKPMKPWHAVIVLILTGVTTFFVTPMIAYKFNLGLSATLLNEILMLVFATAAVAIFRGDFRRVFPLQKPKVASVFGTLLFWMGSYGVVMIMTTLITVLFPEQMTSTSQSLNSALTSASFLVAFLIVSISPAICEEAVFRGVFLNSLWGRMNKWAVILVTSLIFGLFHGSIWRLLPTMCLGIAMGYLVIETNNMFYNMLYHAVNNAFPLILLFGLEAIYKALGMGDIYAAASGSSAELPYLAVFGVYFAYTGAAAFFIYIGNHLLHLGRPGYQNGLFPKEKRKILIILISITVGCMVIGYMIYFLSIFLNPDFIRGIMNGAREVQDIL